jgi:hypothetical protein
MPGLPHRLEFLRTTRLPLAALIAIEFVAIVLAVMLGFMANEWRENRKTEAQADRALQSLALEVHHNHVRIEQTFPYFVRMLEALTEAAAAEPEADWENRYGQELPGWQGFQAPMLRSSTWQMLLSTGILAEMDFELAGDLALLYQAQSLAETLDRQLIERATMDDRLAAWNRIQHLFSLYSEVLPSIMTHYQTLGRPLLAEHGYDREVEPEGLREAMLSHEVVPGR